MIGRTTPNSYTALFANAHLFGPTAVYFQPGNPIPQETGFYFHDAERLPELIEAIRRTDADFVGLAEVWDAGMQDTIREELQDRFPHAVASPVAPGIGRILSRVHERWPRLAEMLFAEEGGVVNLFTRRHYSLGKTSLVSQYLTEDRIGRSLEAFLRSGPVWGAGLLFLSRHAIVSHRFVPHPVRADWERLTYKGVLWANVGLPCGRILRINVGHYQEGVSPEAVQARRSQIHKTKEVMDTEPGPVLAKADYNVASGTLEYEWMMRTLNLSDPGSEETYWNPNPYQDKLKAPRTLGPSSSRLDYILHNEEIETLETRVLADEFRASHGKFSLSDHHPVLSRFCLCS